MSNRIIAVTSLSIVLMLAPRPLQAQEPPPPTRIAVVNMGDVLRQYARLSDGLKELQAAAMPYWTVSNNPDTAAAMWV